MHFIFFTDNFTKKEVTKVTKTKNPIKKHFLKTSFLLYTTPLTKRIIEIKIGDNTTVVGEYINITTTTFYLSFKFLLTSFF